MSAVSKADVLHAIILREVRVRYAGRRLGYLWALFEPMMHIAAFLVIFYAMGRVSPVSENLVIFLGTGILPWLLFVNTEHRTSQAINANRALLLYPHVYPVDFMLGRAILECATWLCILSALLFAAWLHDGIVADDPIGMLASWSVIGLLATGLGMVNAHVFDMFPAIEKLYKALLRVLYLTSGIFFLVHELPVPVQEKLSWNPLLILIDWFRGSVLPSYDQVPFGLLPVTVLALCLFLSGMMMERIRRREVRSL